MRSGRDSDASIHGQIRRFRTMFRRQSLFGGLRTLRKSVLTAIFSTLVLTSILCLFFTEQESLSWAMVGTFRGHIVSDEYDGGSIVLRESRPFWNGQQVCRIPSLDPYHEDVRLLEAGVPPRPCNMHMMSRIVGDTLRITGEGIVDAGFYYIDRKPGDDFTIVTSEWHSMFLPVETLVSKGTVGCLRSKGVEREIRIGSKPFIIGEKDDCTYLKLIQVTDDGRVKHLNSGLCLSHDKVTVGFVNSCSTSSVFSIGENGDSIRLSGTNQCLNVSASLATFLPCEQAQKFYMVINDKQELSAQLHEEFVMVRIQKESSFLLEYHAHVIRTRKIHQPFTNSSLNIAVIMYDSQSHSNAKRHMKKTYNFLSSHPDTFIFNGMTAVGDGTTAQLVAQLTGVPEPDLPEARRGMPGAQTVDRYPFIFKELRVAGYVSVLSEDDPVYGAFTYRLKGFRDQPCDKYLRPFWLDAISKLSEYSVSCTHQVNLNYLRKFFDVYRDVKKFAYITNARCCHNNVSQISYADQDTYELYKYFEEQGHLDNTVVILFGDHGARTGKFRASVTGKLEERLPLFTLTVPPWFRLSYPEFYLNLKKNQDILLSHYDVYATFRHLMNLSAPAKKYPVHTGIAESLLTNINGTNRTCKSAGIENHWCPCLEYDQVSVSDKHVVRVASDIVAAINKALCERSETCLLCASLTLRAILRAGKREANELVQQFVSTKRDSRCDSCGVNLQKTRKDPNLVYEVVVELAPSGGQFEASAEVQFTNYARTSIRSVKVDPLISRLNRYNDQPACIGMKYPFLRNFCYCLQGPGTVVP